MTSLKQASPPQHWRLSRVLRDFLAQHPAQQICLEEVLQAMGDRAFGPTLLICALPEALPLPIAGVSAFVAIPLILVSTQLILGFRKPWLPARITQYSFQRKSFEQLVNKAIGPLERLERFFKPRWHMFTHPLVQRLIGVLLLLLALIVALPIPFGNMIPAIIIVIICLGMIEQDGLMLALSGVITCVVVLLLAGGIATLLPIPRRSP
jgi:hypothetical protein